MKYKCSNCNESCRFLLSGDLCFDCYSLREKVRKHCCMARRNGAVGDLTLAEWCATLNYFQHCCAYCRQKAAFHLCLEHYIALTCGGGTTISNCVPACEKCNSRKKNLLPDKVTLIPKADMERVYEYLSSLINSSDIS